MNALQQMNRRLDGSQSRCRRFGEDRSPLTLPGVEPRFLFCSVISLGTVPIKLSRLSTSSKFRLCISGLYKHAVSSKGIEWYEDEQIIKRRMWKAAVVGHWYHWPEVIE